MTYSEHRGVSFIEGLPDKSDHIGDLPAELSGLFTQNQSKSLDDLKDKMRAHALANGGNCVVDFKYFQKPTFLKGLFSMDDLMWHGSGKVARINPATLDRYRRVYLP